MWDRPTNPRLNMFCSSARTQHWPQGSTLAEKLWGSKEDLLQTTQFINAIKLNVWGQSWITEEEEEDGIKELGCLYQILFRATELFCKRDSCTPTTVFRHLPPKDVVNRVCVIRWGQCWLRASLYEGQNCRTCSGVGGHVSQGHRSISKLLSSIRVCRKIKHRVR